MSSTALIVIPDHGELQRYQDEVSRYPLLTAEEEQELARRYKYEQDLEAAHRLVTSHLRYVVKIAREYRGYGLRMMDLVQEGSVGLMQAVKRFDPEKGFRLSTYALWWIRATIQEFVLRSWSLVKVATTTAQRKLFFSLRKAKETIELLDEAGAEELGRKLGVDARTVLEMDRRLASPDTSLNRPAIEEGEELLDRLADHRGNQEQRLMARQHAHLRQEASSVALEALDSRERLIVEERIMNPAPATLESLGERLGISRERVRQLEKRALEKMRRAVEHHFDDVEPLAALA